MAPARWEELFTGARREGLEGGVELLELWLRRVAPRRDVLVEQLREWAPQELDGRVESMLLPHMERVYHIMRVFRAMAEAAGEKLTFGGGSIINYIYLPRHREPPRLTFVVDSASRRKLEMKRHLLSLVLEVNRWLSERGESFILATRREGLPVGFIVWDAEKDYFPNMLSLKMPIITLYGSGAPIHTYFSEKLRVSLDYESIARLREVARAFGARELRVEEVRAEITLEPVGDAVEERVELPFKLGSVTASITNPHLQVAMKIVFKLARSWSDEDLRYVSHDMLKALLDTRLAEHLDKAETRSHIEHLGGAPLEQIKQNLARAEANLEKHYTSFHYSLVKLKYPNLADIKGKTMKTLTDILENT